MIRESDVSQKEPGVFRRWFHDDYFDIIVWYGIEHKTITGFQICYDKTRNEHAIMWNRDTGFSHHAIDDSRSQYKHPATPILVDDGIFPFEKIIGRFRESSTNMDPVIRSLIIEKLTEYSKER
jgi:hypothetical protein